MVLPTINSGPDGDVPPRTQITGAFPPTPAHSQATAFPRAIQNMQKLARMLQDRVAGISVYNVRTMIAAQRRWFLLVERQLIENRQSSCVAFRPRLPGKEGHKND